METNYRVIDTDRLNPSLEEGDPLNDVCCTICFGLPFVPHATACEHYFCTPNGCPDGWIKTNDPFCPTCREPTQADLIPAIMFIRNMVNSRNVRCSHNPEHIVRMEALKAHEDKCPDGTATCPNEGCNSTMARRDLPAHTEECEWVRVECPDGCGQVLCRHELPSHSCIRSLKAQMMEMMVKQKEDQERMMVKQKEDQEKMMEMISKQRHDQERMMEMMTKQGEKMMEMMVKDQERMLQSLECVQTLQGHTNAVWTLAVLPGTPLVSFVSGGGSDKSIRVWRATPDTEKYECVQTLQGHTNAVRTLAVLPGTPLVSFVSGSCDNSIRVWR